LATVLIVEDEEPLRELLAEVVEDAGHRALRAIHGRHALELIDQQRPDLVIADVMMPVLNGVELCRRLKGEAATRSIPVILISAAGERPARGAGADAFVDKPFSLEHIEALVRRWLD
jgi:CheY-like chemotaxis protein